MTGRVTLLLAALAALGFGLSGCVAPWSQAAVPVTPEVVEVRLDEFDIAVDHDVVDPGRVVFGVRNIGDIDHELTLVALPDDVRGVAEWLETVGGTIPIYSTKNRAPGEGVTFAADLAPGKYGLLCVLQESVDHVSHHDQGMVADLRVGAPEPASGDDELADPEPS